MSVSPGFQTFVLDQLRRAVPNVQARRMFGGVGLYGDDLIFAIIFDDVFYLKVDDTTRADFESRGMPAFRPFGNEAATMQYYQLPEEVLEDPEALQSWVARAFDVSRRAKGRARKGRRSKE
jgi:DNA transformation protein and related proteins